MKILIAEDDHVSRAVLHRLLSNWGHEPVVAQDGAEAWRLLQRDDAPRLAILDWMMPGLDGVQLCREIRRRHSELYTYVLLLTSKRGQGAVIEGLESGADDFIGKPFDPQELNVRLRTGERILDLLQQLVATREIVRDLALHDALTGLWNRAGILELLDNELARARREASSVGLVLVDLDRFKSINDTHGHLVGDQVLRATAQAIRDAIRPYDHAGRYGGDELLIVLPGCDEVNAVSHAERVRCALSNVVVPTGLGKLRLTASLGVAVAEPQEVLDAQHLLAAADVALYDAKYRGRDRVESAATHGFPRSLNCLAQHAPALHGAVVV